MIRKVIVPLLALWAVVAAPVLCAAGVLAHDCQCVDEVACDHESDCDQDPCSELLFRRDECDQNLDLREVAIPLVPVLVSAIGPETPAEARPAPLPPGSLPSGWPSLGVLHASDLPLLI